MIIVVMEELVTITIVNIFIGIFFIINVTNTERKRKKLIPKEKKVKNNGTYNTIHGPLSQEWIDGRY